MSHSFAWYGFVGMIFAGAGLIAYVIGWIVMPEEPLRATVPVAQHQSTT